jgi:hypothetical protein
LGSPDITAFLLKFQRSSSAHRLVGELPRLSLERFLRHAGLGFGEANFRRLANFCNGQQGLCSNENYRLRTGDIKAAATAFTREHIVDAHHVVAGCLKPRAILFIGAARRLLFPGSLKPAHFIFRALATVRATEGRLFKLLLFVKEILFVHFVTKRLWSSVFGLWSSVFGSSLFALRFPVHGSRFPVPSSRFLVPGSRPSSLAQFPQIAKTVDSRFVSIAPAKV